MPKNASNTNVLPFRSSLLALFESAQPHRMNARSLSTEGLDLLGGALHEGFPFESGFGPADKAMGE